MATYAIGDIQGCHTELLQLLEQIGFGSSDRLWLTGDLVNRGPRSLDTLRFIKELGDQARIVLGNHDLHLLAIAHHGEHNSSKDTLDEILQAPDRDELLHWLIQQPLLHHDTDLGFTLVHAGIPPQWDLPEALARAREVESALTSELASDFFRHMYGNNPCLWREDLDSWARLRCITNYFTRMRFCTQEGQLELKTDSGPTSSPAGYRPWFSFKQRKTRDVPIIFGHWAALEGRVNQPHLHALDTGCVWGGTLTAMRLEDGQKFSCGSPGYA
jgi:bis(5'-nucleosyl)-tetraphosphatase (symmetrical)